MLGRYLHFVLPERVEQGYVFDGEVLLLSVSCLKRLYLPERVELLYLYCIVSDFCFFRSPVMRRRTTSHAHLDISPSAPCESFASGTLRQWERQLAVD